MKTINRCLDAQQRKLIHLLFQRKEIKMNFLLINKLKELEPLDDSGDTMISNDD